MPCIAKAWKISDDGRQTTITLRKGMKWSDGAPFTANDFVFWHEERPSAVSRQGRLETKGR